MHWCKTADQNSDQLANHRCTAQFVLQDQLKLIAHDVQALIGDQTFSRGLVMHMNVSEDDDQQCFHQLQAFWDVMWQSRVKPL